MTDIEYRNVSIASFERRFLDGDDVRGAFAGYANLHGVTDTYGTRFAPGAWVSGTPDLDQPTALLWMHDAASPVGVFTAKEDAKGLFIEGSFDQTDEGQRARGRAMSGSAPELSVGFVRLRNGVEDEDEIISARLVEVSLITARMASTPGAALTAVRSKVGEVRAWPPVEGSFEERTQRLRDAAEAWAVARFGERGPDNDWWLSVEATFAETVVVTVEQYGETPSRTSWEFPYTMAEDGAVELGEPREVDVVSAIQRGEAADLNRRRRGLAMRLRLTESPLRPVAPVVPLRRR